MKHWLRLHLLALTSTLKLILQSPIASLLNLLMVGIAVAMPLGLYLLVANLQSLAGKLPAEPQATVYLRPTAEPHDVERVRQLLSTLPQLQSLQHIDKNAALQELEQNSGMGALLAGLGENPLPDAFAIQLKQATPAQFDALATQAKTDPAVEHVQMDSAWAQRLQAILQLGQEVVLTVAVLFGIGLLLANVNLIRMQILTRREEIEVAKLIGATDSFIRRPFVYFAALQGLLGAMVGMGIVAFACQRLNRPIAELAQMYGQQFSLQMVGAGELLAVFALVMALSWLGAALSVRRHLQSLMG